MDGTAEPVERYQIRVRGAVQGVGFRPYIYGLARRYGLSGWVLNDGAGVLIDIEGAQCRRLIESLSETIPPLARIESVEITALAPAASTGFEIRASDPGLAVSTGIGPDAAICRACLAELCDPADRRYRYPFLNCTDCGPRYTITRRLPYDRPQTSMAGFALCPACAAEYRDPADRRFHAQPTACPVCGPRLSMPIAEILARLRRGQIVAIKGLGGFHLACDASNPDTVSRLRQLKQRDGKPFAIMVANLASARAVAEIDPVEATLLESAARPVVLVKRKNVPPTPTPPPRGGRGFSGLATEPSLAPSTNLVGLLAPDLAPDLAWIGIVLPYTPLHYLLFHEAAGRPAGVDWLDQPQPLTLVMTSANPGGEPLAIGNQEARERLTGIADAVVDHDREILVRADDSVVRVIAGAPIMIRRARGYVPEPIALAREGPSVLAVGGHLKTTVCVTRGRHAYLSQHVGDLDNAATIGFFGETVAHLLAILQVEPVAVAHDRHPDFFSTRFAESLGLPQFAIQHHHAHIASVLAEHASAGPALGLALDGFGLGVDNEGAAGGSWGGELLLVEGGRFERLGRLAALPQPGGDLATRQPWRMAAAALHRLGRGDEIMSRFGDCGPADGVRQLLERGLNAPLSSSCGRWFDAACGLLGVRLQSGFEGEAPMVLESLVTRPEQVPGTWTVADGVLDLLPLLDHLSQINAADGANRFHGTLVAALIDWTLPELERHRFDRVVLAGGCLINRVLAEGLIAGFARHGVTALTARRAPPNDGGLSLGQAWVAVACLEAAS